MSMDRADWEELQARKLESRVANAPKESGNEKNVAKMLAGKLVASQEWNKLSEYAARNILKCDGLIRSYQSILLSPERVNQEEIMAAKIGYHAHLAARDAYEDILNYPQKFKKVED